MATCPFCKEEVRDEAIKCRHCHSMLLPGLSMPVPAAEAVAAPVDNRTVTYVVDKGIVNFAKFAAATLGIFLIIGTYVFGIKVEDTVKEIGEAQLDLGKASLALKQSQGEASAVDEAIRKSTDLLVQKTKSVDDIARQAKAIEDGIAARQSTITQQSDKIQQNVADANGKIVQFRNLIQQSETKISNDIIRSRSSADQTAVYTKQAKEYLNSVLPLQPDQQTVLQENKNSDPSQFRSGSAGNSGKSEKLWPIGKVILVKFLDGTDEEKQSVRSAFALWLRYANLKVQYVAGQDANIRILFFPSHQGDFSYLGTDALAFSGDQDVPTMHIEPEGQKYFPSGEKNSSYSYVLREVGHALGINDEWNNPKARQLINKQALYKYFGDPPFSFPKGVIDQNFFSNTPYPGSRPFDRSSVMNYNLPEYLFSDHKGTSHGETLSESDKAYIASLYPAA